MSSRRSLVGFWLPMGLALGIVLGFGALAALPGRPERVLDTLKRAPRLSTPVEMDLFLVDDPQWDAGALPRTISC